MAAAAPKDCPDTDSEAVVAVVEFYCSRRDLHIISMSVDPLDDNKSDLQQEIQNVYDRNPDAGPNGIASMCDRSAPYVRETNNECRNGLGDDFLR